MFKHQGSDKKCKVKPQKCCFRSVINETISIKLNLHFVSWVTTETSFTIQRLEGWAHLIWFITRFDSNTTTHTCLIPRSMTIEYGRIRRGIEIDFGKGLVIKAAVFNHILTKYLREQTLCGIFMFIAHLHY